MSRMCRNCLKPLPARAEQVAPRARAQSVKRERPRVGRVPAHLAVRLALLVAGRAVRRRRRLEISSSPVRAVIVDDAGDVGARVGDELLGAVDRPVAVVERRAGPDVAGVASPPRARSARTRRACWPAAQVRQPAARCCSSVPKRAIGWVPREVCAHRVIATLRVDACELLHRERVRERVPASAADLLGEGDAHEAELAELARRSRRGSASRGRAPPRRARSRCGRSPGPASGSAPWSSDSRGSPCGAQYRRAIQISNVLQSCYPLRLPAPPTRPMLRQSVGPAGRRAGRGGGRAVRPHGLLSETSMAELAAEAGHRRRRRLPLLRGQGGAAAADLPGAHRAAASARARCARGPRRPGRPAARAGRRLGPARRRAPRPHARLPAGAPRHRGGGAVARRPHEPQALRGAGRRRARRPGGRSAAAVRRPAGRALRAPGHGGPHREVVPPRRRLSAGEVAAGYAGLLVTWGSASAASVWPAGPRTSRMRSGSASASSRSAPF